MAQLRGHREMTNAALNADRSKAVERRRAVEKPEELPSFAEPRRILSTRQDSLTNQIHEVLGDIDSVHHAIGSNPNVWLGTSRNAPTSRNSSSKIYSTVEKARQRDPPCIIQPGSDLKSTNSISKHSSKPVLSSNSKLLPGHSQSSKPIKESSLMPSSNKQASLHSKSSSSAFVKQSSSSSNLKSNLHSDSRAQSSPHGASTLSTNIRNRLASMDMPQAMENIFREMRMNEEEPISEIQTPQIGQEFNFNRNDSKSKLLSQSDSHEDVEDAGNSEIPLNSDSESSDDDESESDDNEFDDNNKWKLSQYMNEMQKPASSPDRLTAADLHGNENITKSADVNTIGVLKKPDHTNGSKNSLRNQNSISNSFKDQTSRNDPKKVSSSTVQDEKKPSSHSNSIRNSNHAKQPSSSQQHEPSKKVKRSHNQSEFSNLSRNSNAIPKQSQAKLSQKSILPPNNTKQGGQDKSRSFTTNTSHSQVLPQTVPSSKTASSVSNETVSSVGGTHHHRTGIKAPSSALPSSMHQSDKSGFDSSDSDSSSVSSCSSESGQLSPRTDFEASTVFTLTSDPPDQSKIDTNGASDLSRKRSFRAANSDDDDDRVNDEREPYPYNRNSGLTFKVNDETKNSNAKVLRQSTTMLSPARKNKTEQSFYKQPKVPISTCAATFSELPGRRSVKSDKFRPLLVNLPFLPPPSPSTKSKKLCNDKHPHNHAEKPSSKPGSSERFSTTRCDSTGFSLAADVSEANTRLGNVRVALAESSSSVSPNPSKRKNPGSDRYNAASPNKSGIPLNKSKRKRSESASKIYRGHSVDTARESDVKTSQLSSKQIKKEANLRKGGSDEASKKLAAEFDERGQQVTSRSNRESMTDPQVSVPNNVAECDSSLPEQETRFKTSEQYMREGKRLKHEGDSITDSKTGRTRAGEALSRALIYFEAALCFLMNGYMLEKENSNERGDSTRNSHSPTNMYNQTISLLDYIRKMRPHDGAEEIAFKRLNISCLRTQSLLHLRVYKLKKDIATKYHEAILEHFKPNKFNHLPSPVSPAVPSPFANSMPGPSPKGSTNSACEQVSSSTQVGKMTSPPSQNNVMLPPKIYEMFKYYHGIMGSLIQAHEKWDQAENLFAEHKEFFRHVDVLRGHSLNLDNSLRDLNSYNKVILLQLKAANKSPKE